MGWTRTRTREYNRDRPPTSAALHDSYAAVQALLAQHAFTRLKLQKCFVGDDLFLLWVTHKIS